MKRLLLLCIVLFFMGGCNNYPGEDGEAVPCNVALPHGVYDVKDVGNSFYEFTYNGNRYLTAYKRLTIIGAVEE